jgi:predicted nucleic acid-binding protein
MDIQYPAFVDTNILVYAFDRTDPDRRSIAGDLIHTLIETNRMRISTQVLQEFLVTVTRKIETPLDVEEAISLMDDLAVAPVYIIEPHSIREAARLSSKAELSYWDAMIVVAAAHSNATRLYTEDLNHGQKILDVEVVNPFL